MEPKSRRFGAETSATRTALVEAGIAVLETEGAAALTARRVAEQAGLKPQLVHYYFRTIEDLVIAIVRHGGQEAMKRTMRALVSEEPLREMWNNVKAGRIARLGIEIHQLAQHSDAIRKEAVGLLERHRALMTEAIERHLEVRGATVEVSPMTILMLIEALGRFLASERSLGFETGHEQIEALAEAWLDRIYAKDAG